MLFQLTAFSLTGKDTLYKNLNNLQSLGWIVYGPSTKLLFPTKNARRIALADILKIMVIEELKMDQIENPSTVHPLIKVTKRMTAREWFEGGWADLLKDIPPEEVNLSLQGKTFRQWLIDYGYEKKQKIKLTYFVDAIKEDVKKCLETNIHVFITDTRYPYEVFPEAVTIRLFRSDVPIADEKVHSERSMDNYKCSYVLCKNDEDFEILKKMQPQYSDYFCHGPLIMFAL